MRKIISHLIETERFGIGMRVRINKPDHFMHGMCAEVINRDAYTVEIRMDVVTEQMKGYEDARSGVVNFEPKDLEVL